jgi:hypothetical protein
VKWFIGVEVRECIVGVGGFYHCQDGVWSWNWLVKARYSSN